MKFIRKTIKVGNSSGVLLPKKLLGSEVKVIVVNRPKNIKRDVLKAIEKDLGDVVGICITQKKPVEVFVISNTLRKKLEKEDMKIIFVPVSVLKRDLKTNDNLRNKISKAEPIMNSNLLDELKQEARL
jgi:hypothetical protein